MKWFRLALAAGASLLAMTAHAHADFIVTPILFLAGGGGALFGGGALTIAGLTVPQFLAAAVAVGTSLISAFNRPKVNPGEYKNTFEADDSSEVNAIGRVALGGLNLFGNTSGFNRYRLFGHCKGPLIAVEEYRLGQREVTVEADGYVSSPPYARNNAIPSYVRWQMKIGDGTETAWPDLISAFPSLWTVDHRVRGIAQSLLQYISPGIYSAKFGKMYQSGEPDPMVIARVNTVYDPRVSGADPDDTETWVWSMNGPLCAARIMLAYPDLTVDDFDWDFIADEADKADVLVETLTGTEPRSRCSGIWLSEAERGPTMDDVLRSIGAEIVLSDEGLVRIRLVDDAPTSEIGFTTKHIVDFDWKSGPEAVERPNVCRVKYYSSERNYEVADIDMSGVGWAKIDDEIERYGEKFFDVELPFCPSASQAQRIARREFLLARADTGQVITNMAGLAAWGLTYADIELPDLDETPLCKMAPPRIDDDAGQVEIPFAVWPLELLETAWNPATMEAAAPEVIPPFENESELTTPTAPTEAIQVQYPGGTKEVRVGYVEPVDGNITEAVYRIYTDDLPSAPNSMVEISGATDLAYAAATDLEGGTVDFRFRRFNNDGDASYFSDPLLVEGLAYDNTTPAAPAVTASTYTQGVDTLLRIDFTVADLQAVSAEIETTDDNGATWDPHDTVDVRPGTTSIETGIIVGAGYGGRVRLSTSDGTTGPFGSDII